MPTHYAQAADVLAFLALEEGDIDALKLTQAINRAELDIDAAAGMWVAFSDTGLKFASDVEDVTLSDLQVTLLKRATCQQVEYRLTVGDDFMIREQHDSESGPDGGVSGKVRKVTSAAYSSLHAGGLLRLYGSFEKCGRGRGRGVLPSA